MRGLVEGRGWGVVGLGGFGLCDSYHSFTYWIGITLIQVFMFTAI